MTCIILSCVIAGCILENIPEEEGLGVEVPVELYFGPLSGKWDLISNPSWPDNSLTLDGAPTDHGVSSIRLYANWEFILTIIGIDGYDDCIASGYWLFESGGIFVFTVIDTTNPIIINLGEIRANYIYSSGWPQSLFLEYTTDMGLLVSMDCLKF